MTVRTITYDTGIFTVFRELFYTLAQTGEEPLAAPHVPVFEGLRDDAKGILLQEIAILELLAKARAAVDRADRNLDRFVGRVLRTVDEHTDGTTRQQLRKKLLKGKAMSRLRKPVLGRQLNDMADWSKILTESGVPALMAHAAEAGALHEAGKTASAQRDAAQAANRAFRDVGARKQFIDKLNADRKSTDGALAKLPFENVTLPQDFEDGFFLHEAPREDEDEQTVETVKAAIVALKNELAEQEALLIKLEQEAADAAKEAQEALELDVQASALEAQAAELLKKAAELKNKKK